MSVSRRALLTFAFVSEALKSHHDIIVGLAPLFNPIATDLSGQIFSANQLREELLGRYGLSVTNDVAEFVSFSLHKAGLLKRREIGSDDLTFFWVAPPHSPINEPSHFEKIISELGQSALGFAKLNPSLLNFDLNEEKAINLIFDWIIDTDKQLSEAEQLYASTDNEPQAVRTKLLRSEDEYFCSRFIEWLRKERNELYEVLSEVGNAVMVSEVIMELREPSFSPGKKGELFVYLDAPLCMEILGCSGKARKDDSTYLVSRLKQFGATVAVFTHSIDEMRDNLNAVLKNPPNERRGPTATALLTREVVEDHLFGVLRNTDQYLADAGIEIYDIRKSPIPVSNETCFPASHQNDLLSRLQQNYKRLEAAERDALSAAIVMRRRNRHRSSDLFRARHVMITRNPMVSAVTRKFCVDIGAIEPNQFGPIIHARQAAALIWFAVGATQKLEISRRQLVLNCSKAIESTPKIIERLRHKLSEIKPETVETFDALIREPRNLQVAMDFVQGSESRALESDPDALLNKLTETLTQEERSKHTQDMRALRRQHRGEISQVVSENKALQERVQTLEDEAATRRREQLRRVEESFLAFAERCKRAIIFSKAVFSVLSFGVVFLTSSVLLQSLDEAFRKGWTLALSGFAGLLVAVPVFLDPSKLIESVIQNFYKRKFEKDISLRKLEDASLQVSIDWTRLELVIKPDPTAKKDKLL